MEFAELIELLVDELMLESVELLVVDTSVVLDMLPVMLVVRSEDVDDPVWEVEVVADESEVEVEDEADSVLEAVADV